MADASMTTGDAVFIGHDYWKLRNGGERVPVSWNVDDVPNHHIGVAGTSGAGKTHWIRRFVAGLPEDVEIDIFDCHGDIEVPGAVSVLFSEATRHGFNPLTLNPDPHYGGVRRAIADLIDTLNTTSRRLGTNQEAVLRNLLTDTYALRGIYADNARTWTRREGTEGELRMLTEQRNWKALREYFPTLDDVTSVARRKLKALWLGIEEGEGGRAALAALDDYCRAIAGVHRTRLEAGRGVSGANGAAGAEDPDRGSRRLELAKSKALDAFGQYVEALQSGRELDEAMKYHSREVLHSVITRLENLTSSGIFNPNPPPFGAARIRRYLLKPLAQSDDELRMFVRLRLRAIVREMQQRGESGGRLRRLVVLDESKKFNDEETSNPLNVIVNEMRKFGLGLLLAGQSPAHFSSDFIKNAGTLLLLNLATADWDEAARRLKITPDMLKYLLPQRTGAVRMQAKGQNAAFRQVQFV